MGMLEKEKLHGSLELKTVALSKMDRLMLLQLNYVKIIGSYNKFPEELRWLCMHGFPLKSIPSDLPMENLVGLDMSYSNIESFGIYYWYPQQLPKRVKQWIGSFSKDKRLLGSLKILNLSFCEQLRSLGGFDHLPKIERLILKGCIGLLNVSESIEQCRELVFVDLSYYSKLQKIPRIIGMLKKVETLLLVGCNLGESQIGIIDIDIIKCSSSIPSTVQEAIPCYSKFFTIYLPTSLVSLSLVNNNLSTESFPMNFSCLSMLEELYLDVNPIVSMPRCVRSLPRLEKLSMTNCNMLTSVEHPPHTLTYLDLYSREPMLQKVVFDPEMSPLQLLSIDCHIIALSSCEVEGVVKIQSMAGVEEKVLHNLGWTRQDFLNERCVVAERVLRGKEESEIQMYYEFGIFSTIYEGIEMPSWITDRSMGPSISFTIPSSPTNLTGLNFCCVLTSQRIGSVKDVVIFLPVITISNITKNRTWIYHHYLDKVFLHKNCLMFVSHWMFGMREMEFGDHVTITMRLNDAVTKECGVSFVYDDGKEEEEEDVLGYYKSWNHIIGGDLTGFQLTS